MRSLLAVDGSEGPDSLADLVNWLTDETLLRGRVRTHAPVPGTGELGGWTDIVVIAVGAGGALTALARALSVYLQQPRRSTVCVKVVAPDGRRTEVTVEHTKDLIAVEDLLRAALHPNADPAGGVVSSASGEASSPDR
ncbi:hypothetical protein ACFUIW_07460 [Streptomyces sp. NPDC057245]|uniref:effector-associated constant component EACC1 n=1 Tax=Streptomyces TaxID=1883 RepID=UPI001C1DF85F|nr:hypothetical protein [Streptomyces sp. A108]MBU6530811.1 hypothetical protein [Streptomyces sp. A108]